MDVFGQTRSRLARNHALITPDTHVVSTLVGWRNATGVVHISPHMGARFVQYTAHLQADAAGAMPADGIQRFVYVVHGEIELEIVGHAAALHRLGVGGYAFLPAGCQHSLSADRPVELLVFEKRAEPLAGVAAPAPVVGDASDVPGEPFLGDADARLQTLLPISPEYDMAVNIFTYQPGATLPQVEIHIMEHGLMMLDGMGVYRLSDDYYPVKAGDVIWMAPHCPQWFVAMGKEPARYIYYKNVHRDLSCLGTH